MGFSQAREIRSFRRHILYITKSDSADSPVGNDLPAAFARQPVAIGDGAGRPATNEVQHGQSPLKIAPRSLPEHRRLRRKADKVAANQGLQRAIAEQRELGCPRHSGLRTIWCHL